MNEFKTLICRFQKKKTNPFQAVKRNNSSSTRQFKWWKLESSQRRNYALTNRSNNSMRRQLD